jgi:hypothetical protein
VFTEGATDRPEDLACAFGNDQGENQTLVDGQIIRRAGRR